MNAAFYGLETAGIAFHFNRCVRASHIYSSTARRREAKLRAKKINYSKVLGAIVFPCCTNVLNVYVVIIHYAPGNRM